MGASVGHHLVVGVKFLEDEDLLAGLVFDEPFSAHEVGLAGVVVDVGLEELVLAHVFFTEVKPVSLLHNIVLLPFQPEVHLNNIFQVDITVFILVPDIDVVMSSEVQYAYLFIKKGLDIFFKKKKKVYHSSSDCELTDQLTRDLLGSEADVDAIEGRELLEAVAAVASLHDESTII